MTDIASYRKLCREDFYTFAVRAFMELYPDEEFDANWHQELIMSNLRDLMGSRRRRQLILVPPRSLKSFICSVAWPAFLLGHRPSMKIIAVSYAQPLADDLARLTLDLMNSAWFRSVFTTRLRRGKQPADNFHTTRGGYRLATSVGGTLTGRGADLIIIDDPIKAEDAMSSAVRESTKNWFRNTLRSRLNHKAKGQILVVMQRLHQDDPAAMLIEQKWPMLKLAAIATENEEHTYNTLMGRVTKLRLAGEVLHPAREPLEILEELKTDMGSFSFAAQYQQDPVPAEGNIIQRSWIARYVRSELPPFNQIVQSWDTASKGSEIHDFSVCTTWGITKDRHIYLLHVLRRRLTYPDLKRAAREQAELHNADVVLIEDKISGTSLIQDLKRDGFHKVKAIIPKGEKALRLAGVSAMFENGFVHVPSDAPWADDYVDEMISFPGRYDDQVDSTTQALLWIRENRAEPALTTYYREEAERKHTREHVPTVLLQSPTKSWQTVILRDGSQVQTDNDGFITVPETDARALCQGGFTRVVPPDDSP
ncbi:MAG: phage terminase large subunit [Tardiphaga sp.]|nr:phage terminase large subunit [Tardiphaga sp.]